MSWLSDRAAAVVPGAVVDAPAEADSAVDLADAADQVASAAVEEAVACSACLKWRKSAKKSK